MLIEPIDVDDDTAVQEWCEPIQASDRHDWPGDPGWATGELSAFVRHRSTATNVLAVVRGTGGTVEGSLWVAMPTRESRHVADIRVSVRPHLRGQGIGRLLLEAGEEIARSHGRTHLVSTTEEPLHAVEPSRNSRFARAAGYEVALEENRRELRLPIPVERLESLAASCAPSSESYRIVTWSGACPDELTGGRVALARSISTDAPHGSLDKEEEKWDLERLRDVEATTFAMGRNSYSAGAVEVASGDLVGVTEIAIPRALPSLAYQYDTIVLPEHRGHRLGTLVKVANLRAVGDASPATERIITWNAAANGPMISVNDVMGFEVTGNATVWQKVIP